MEEKFLHAEEPEAERNLAFQTKEDLSNSSEGKSFAVFNLHFKIKQRFCHEIHKVYFHKEKQTV